VVGPQVEIDGRVHDAAALDLGADHWGEVGRFQRVPLQPDSRARALARGLRPALIASESTGSGLRLAFAARLASRWMPGSFPVQP
jgi:hypothetical protein